MVQTGEFDFVATSDSLSDGQREAVLHKDGPAAVYAGPGSGKTRVVTLRAARMTEQGRRLLVTTFTNDATVEMRTRIEQMLTGDRAECIHVTTMHALCLQILRTAGVKFKLLTDEFQRRSLADAARAAELEGGTGAFLTLQSYQKNTGVTAARYRHDGSAEDIEFAAAWRRYEKAKSEKGFREFDDLILDVVALFQQDDGFRGSIAARYSHIIVDECQDMNRPQYAVAFALGQDHKNVMLVGDLDQSLYGFRGADTETFRQFAANRRTRVYELRENYRCTQAILRFADTLIRQDAARRALSFVPVRDEGEDVTWQRYPDPDFEALGIAETILHLHQKGMSYRDMAVLYRTNAQSEAFERHFAALETPTPSGRTAISMRAKRFKGCSATSTSSRRRTHIPPPYPQVWGRIAGSPVSRSAPPYPPILGTLCAQVFRASATQFVTFGELRARWQRGRRCAGRRCVSG